MTRVARFALHHRRLVIVFWIAMLIVGGATSGKAVDRMSFDFALPGQAGYETAEKIMSSYGVDTLSPPNMLVIAAPKGQTVNDEDAAKTFAAVQSAVPGIVVVDKKASGGNPIFSTNDGRAQFAYAFIPPQEGFQSLVDQPMLDALKANAPEGTTASLTGVNPLSSTESDSGPGVLAETMLGAVGALAVLLFVFASFLAILPLAIAAVAILSTFFVLLLITLFTDVSFIVQFLVSLIGLGVAIDYSLLIVTRWREERDRGLSNDDAVIASMETAGRAVVFSGFTVAIGLFALVILPVPFLRSIGFGGMLIPLISVLVSLTFLPAILGGIGPKIDWPKIRHETDASKFWTSWARGVVRHRGLAASVAIVILGLLIIPVFHMKIGSASSESLATSGPAYEALKTLEDGGIPNGALTPIVVLTKNDAGPSVAQQVIDVNGVKASFVPTFNKETDTSWVVAVPFQETSNSSSFKSVKAVKDATDANAAVIGVSGVGALQLDYLTGVYGNFPYAFALIVLITYVLLVRAFRSVLLPLKAVLLNVLSLAATFGAMVLFWQWGHGSEAIFDIAATGAITFWLPIMIFAFLFGLSMDYEVFILSRIREEYDHTHDTNEAVVVGTGRTGRLVTSAALILFLAFVALSTGPQTDIKLFATGLGFGILLDATVVRMLLVPALVSLFGEWNWYCPQWVMKVLRIKEPVRTVNEIDIRPDKVTSPA